MAEAASDLAGGCHPAVVAARLGVTADDVARIANERGWAIAWQPHATVAETLTRHARLLGLDS